MAWSTVKTGVMNPAEIETALGSIGRKVKKMAKRLSDKQIKHFGTKRQKAALAARRAAARHNGAKKRSKSKSFAGKKSSHRPRSKPRSVKNPGPEILALTLGNPAQKRGHKVMATSKKKKKGGGGTKRNTAGRSSKRFGGKRSVRRNPAGLGSPMDWVTGGAGVLAGVVGTRALPQVVLGVKNTGGVGYLANALVAGGLGWLAHMVFPRNRVLTASVLAGGFAALIARVIGDFTQYGKFLTLTGGVGDYMISNAPVPSRLVDPRGALVEVPGGWGGGVQSQAFAAPVDTGVDVGRRGNVC